MGSMRPKFYRNPNLQKLVLILCDKTNCITHK
uniref:Uncharacterized protein n=1 Tax=Anguilla anguilla TaxID=7936 RepID=A0A0E9QY90_ANGAN